MDILSSLNKNGSGLNLKELTTSLVAAEIQPKQSTITKRITATEASISAIGSLRSSMDTLSVAVSAIQSTPILSARSSSASAATAVITDPARLTEATTDINVRALATRQVMEFTGFTGTDAVIGGGTMTVEVGVWVDTATNDFVANPDKPVQTITLGETATLQDLADALNELEGVTARVLDKGDGTFSLGVVSEIGAANGLRFGVTPTGTSTLTDFDTTATIATRQITSAADAMVEIDGLTVFRPTNSISDLIDGARIDLTAVGTTSITISRDRETAAANMEFLVDTLNETLTQLSALTSRGANGGTRGALAGDRTAESLIDRIRSMIAAPISGFGNNAIHLADLGVATERYGSLSFDREAFDRAFDADPALMDAAFTDSLSSTSAGVSVIGTPYSLTESGSFDFSRPDGTGSATIGGAAAIGTSLGDGRTRFVPLGGPFAGTVVTANDGITTATLRFGRSFASMLSGALDDALAFSGALSSRESQLNEVLLADQDALVALDTKATNLETRYLEKFTAMEVAISQLKSTGSYITAMVDSWNNDN